MNRRVKAKLVISPQCGMGPLWYPYPFRLHLGYALSKIDYRLGSYAPLVSRRDMKNELAYKGPVYAETIWNVQNWTKQNMNEAHLINIPFHMTMVNNDTICSSERMI